MAAISAPYVSVSVAHQRRRRCLLMIVDEETNLNLVSQFALYADHVDLADKTILNSRSAPVQSVIQSDPAASRAAMAAVANANPLASCDHYDPRSGEDPLLSLRRKVAGSDMVVLLSSSNLLDALVTRAVVLSPKTRLLRVRSATCVECFEAGYASALRLRNPIEPDLETMARICLTEDFRGTLIVGRTRCCDRSVVLRIPPVSRGDEHFDPETYRRTPQADGYEGGEVQ